MKSSNKTPKEIESESEYSANTFPNEYIQLIVNFVSSPFLTTSFKDMIAVSLVNRQFHGAVTTYFNTTFYDMLKDPKFRKSINTYFTKREGRILSGLQADAETFMEAKPDDYYKRHNKPNEARVKSQINKILPDQNPALNTFTYTGGGEAYSAFFRCKDRNEAYTIFDFFKKKHSPCQSRFKEIPIVFDYYLYLYVREHELSILNDSVITKNRPDVINTPHILDAINERTACLLGERMNETPFSELIHIKEKGDIKLVLRFRDFNNTREVMFALQKESYDFPSVHVCADNNTMRHYDIYPSQHVDPTTNTVRYSITGSSVTLQGIAESCCYIFDACELGKEQVKSLIDLCEKLEIDKENIKMGFTAAFLRFIKNKITEFEKKQKNTGWSWFTQNNSAIALKLKYLQEMKTMLTGINKFDVISFEKLDQFFQEFDVSQIKNNTLKHYLRFKEVYYEMCKYLKPALENTEESSNELSASETKFNV